MVQAPLTFNKDNVTLIDTARKDVDCLTKDAFAVGGVHYPVNVIIFATTFRAPNTGTPAEKANLVITGHNNFKGQVERILQDKKMIVARSGIWAMGIEDYCRQSQEWVDEGSMAGIEVRM
ncbi:hypothetical protein BPAE_0250g00060 [Botrytis paeoniae]|uniref:Uncharacterized protein n=1 Tax=Botrytis paeoniae TaxID=278948 RepID=A0A4Z1F880_9HELO|nr:hypothetical protein BPAE_0250g00060 [Botrytis paeoniae]